jgi:glycosyltransferase involved in cell wall biosynthesis
VCSQWLADLLRDEYGQAGAAVVPNGVDTAQFHAPPRGRQARPTVGLLYSNRWIKGCGVSLDAIALASRKIPGLHLRAFGWNDPKADLPLPAGAEYTRQPPQDQLRHLYAGCDVWLCGSRSEGFHLPPHEAMACRCPVVSTRVGGPMDLIEDGVNGYLVDVGDAQGLADRLVDVLSLPEPQWRQMSDAAYAKATSYTWEAATDMFENALRKALAREPRAPARSTM